MLLIPAEVDFTTTPLIDLMNIMQPMSSYRDTFYGNTKRFIFVKNGCRKRKRRIRLRIYTNGPNGVFQSVTVLLNPKQVSTLGPFMGNFVEVTCIRRQPWRLEKPHWGMQIVLIEMP
jgi:hypothetical protein